MNGPPWAGPAGDRSGGQGVASSSRGSASGGANSESDGASGSEAAPEDVGKGHGHPANVESVRAWEFKSHKDHQNLTSDEDDARSQYALRRLRKIGADVDEAQATEDGGPRELGNCSFALFNFGETARAHQKNADEITQIKKAPTSVVGVLESTNDLLQHLTTKEGNLAPHLKDTLERRAGKTWLCIKGGEAKGTPMLALDDRSGGRIKLVRWDKRPHKKKGPRGP